MGVLFKLAGFSSDLELLRDRSKISQVFLAKHLTNF